MAERGRHRAEATVLLACVLVVTVLFGVDALRGTGRYRSHVDFAMEVPLPAAHWDPELDALTPSEAIERARDLAEGDEVQGAIEEELDYEHVLDVEVVDDQTLRFTGEAGAPSLAANTATAAAAIYGQLRVRDAQAAAEAVLPELRAAADAAAGTAEEEDALRRLHAAEDTVELGPAGGPRSEADVPGSPAREPLLPALLRGAAVGLVVGLAAVGLWRLDRRYGGAWRDRRASSGTGGDAGGAGDTRATVAPRWWTAPWAGPVVVTTLVAARSLYYAVLGPRLILDDWLLTYRGQFYGVLRAVPEVTRAAQPTKWAWLTLIFGVSGEHPLVLFVLVSLVNVAAAVAVYYALARFFPAPVPLLVASLWVLTANHSSLTVWAAASQAVVCVLFCCLGVTLLSKGRWLLALAAFAASTLAYEFTIPICLVAAVLVGTRWLRPRDGVPIVRDVRPWQRGVMVAGLLGIVGWTAAHPKYPVAWRPPDVWDTWSAHVSTGLLGTESAPTLLLRALELGVIAGLAWCAVLWWRGDRDRGRGPALALAGAAVTALGLVTTVLLPGLTIGVSNRLYGASSVGTAMLLVGIVVTVWRRRETVALGLATVLVVVCVVGQVISLRAAHRGGEDVLALLRHLPTVADDPANARFVVAPRPEHDGFYAVDNFFGTYPFKLTYPDGQGNLRLAVDPDELEDPEPGEIPITWEEVLGEAP